MKKFYLSLSIKFLSNLVKILCFPWLADLNWQKTVTKWHIINTSTSLWSNILFCQRWSSNMLPSSYIEVFTHSPQELLQSPHWNFWTIPDVSSLRMRSLKHKTFGSFSWLLNTICHLQQLGIPLRCFFFNLILDSYDNDQM